MMRIMNAHPKGPSPASSRGATLRAVRAAQHLDEVRSTIDAYERDHPDPVQILIPRDQVGAPGYRPIIDWSRSGDPPRAQLAILVGEFAYNLRAGLDYLVHQVAQLDGAAHRFRYFPIDDDPELWDKRRSTWLAGIADEHVDLFRRHQPFAGGRWLALLKAINNPDKHQNLTVVTSQFTGELTLIEDNLRPVPGRDGVVELIQSGIKIEFLLLDQIEVQLGLHIILFEMSRLLDDFRAVFGDGESFTVTDPGVRIESPPPMADESERQ